MPRLEYWILPLLYQYYFLLAYSLRLVVVTSPNTPPEFLSQVSPQARGLWMTQATKVETVTISDWETLTRLVEMADGVVDGTFEEMGVEMLAGVCEGFHVPNFVLGYVSSFLNHTWTYYLSGKQADISAALESLITYFKWTHLNILTDSNHQLSSISSLLRRNSTRDYTVFEIPQGDITSIGQLVGKGIRMSGNRVAIFLTDSNITRTIFGSQHEKHIGGEGFANILPLYSALIGVQATDPPWLHTGHLIVAEHELAAVESRGEYYREMLRRVAVLYDDYTDSATLAWKLERVFPSHSRIPTFDLINMQEGRRVLVGEVSTAGLRLTATVYFLGNTPAVPQNAKLPMAISGNFGVRNAGTLSILPNVHQYYQGAMLAVQQINTWPNLLENFALELFNFSAGVTAWNYEFAWNNVYPDRERLGLAVLAGLSSGVTRKLIELLSDLNFTGAVVGSSTTLNALSSQADYPMFVRTITPDHFSIVVLVQMFKRFGWSKCAIFVSNETWGLGFQAAFSQLAQENGISILNAPRLQVLPTPIPSIDTLRNLTENFRDFIDTKARIFIPIVNDGSAFVIDYLYELGIRGGDIQLIGIDALPTTIYKTNDTEANRKRSELLRGGLFLTPSSYLGSFGRRVYSDYQSKYEVQPSVYACYYYDSALALAYALDIIVRGGGDYTNPAVLLKTLRGSRFTGCSGIVTFDPDTNDRSSMKYNILNAQFGEDGIYITNVSTVALYDPTSTILFRFLSDIIWCDGSKKTPLDIRNSTIGCPFEDKFNQQFPKGRYILYGTCTWIGLLTVSISIVMWYTWRTRPFSVLCERKELQSDDVFVMLGTALEMVQYISLGPSLSYFPLEVLYIISGTTLDIEEYAEYKDGGFEHVWLGVTIAVTVWFAMCLIIFFRMVSCIELVIDSLSLRTFSRFFAPIIGHFFFLPIISTLLDIFSCTHGVGQSTDSIQFIDSYLNKDCYQQCWREHHLWLVAITAVVISAFVVVAVLLRPVWQQTQEQLNIKSSPLYLSVKSAIHMLVVILNKTVKPENRVIHGFVFVGVVAVFAGASVRFPCFSYQRISLWHLLGLLSVIWSALLSLIFTLSGSQSDIVFSCMAGGGWLIIILFGVLYQYFRLPQLLYRKQGINTMHLFKFAFKPATLSVLKSIASSFVRVGNRTSVIIPENSEGQRVMSTVDLTPKRRFAKSLKMPQKSSLGNESAVGIV